MIQGECIFIRCSIFINQAHNKGLETRVPRHTSFAYSAQICMHTKISLKPMSGPGYLRQVDYMVTCDPRADQNVSGQRI